MLIVRSRVPRQQAGSVQLLGRVPERELPLSARDESSMGATQAVGSVPVRFSLLSVLQPATQAGQAL